MAFYPKVRPYAQSCRTLRVLVHPATRYITRLREIDLLRRAIRVTDMVDVALQCRIDLRLVAAAEAIKPVNDILVKPIRQLGFGPKHRRA